jgi:DNA invertase Pin-like site-specific DNA recombinase
MLNATIRSISPCAFVPLVPTGRLNEAGARLVSVEDNFDGSTAMGRSAIGILTLIAELELITESWSTAVTEAVKRRVHISARAPAGYRRAQRRRFSRLVGGRYADSIGA